MALFGPLGGKKRRFGKAIAYTHLPGFLPRLRAMGDTFGHFAFLLALIYRSARLLPAGHPMINPANIGRFGIRDVMASAANALVIKRENTDQIAIFGAVSVALIMIVIQAVVIALYAFMGPANAQQAIFTTAKPDADLAYQFLRQVFGVPNIFGGQGVISQTGLHAILGFYSTAMMIVAVIIVVYYVITIVGESAQTGTPFGKRFNGLWAPIRLVLALGLLVPFGSGLNTAQYLTLYVAKFGSSLATNAWIKFSDTFNTLSNAEDRAWAIGTPSMQPLGMLIYSAEACTELFNRRYINAATGQPTKPVRLLIEFTDSAGPRSMPAEMNAGDLRGKAGSIRYVWTNQPHGGRIEVPTCGSITMQVFPELSSGDGLDSAVRRLQVKYQEAYIAAMGHMRQGFTQDGENGAVGMFVKKFLLTNGAGGAERDRITLAQIAAKIPPVINAAQAEVNALSTSARSDTNTTTYVNAAITNMQKDAKQRGWTSAGAYYIEIAGVSQKISDAVQQSFPSPSESPSGEGTTVMSNGNGWLSGFWSTFYEESAVESEVAAGMRNLPEIMRLASAQVTVPPVRPVNDPHEQKFSAEYGLKRPILVLSRFLFGDALLKLMDEPTLNPMERFVQAGSYILDRSEQMTYALLAGASARWAGEKAPRVGGRAAGAITTGIAAGVMGYLLGDGFYNGVAWAAVTAIAAYMPTIIIFFILLGLVAGIMLFYVLPLLPFMIFFFSVVNWVIEVAEAFVAAPLFALSHLRIDGDGLPGQTAYAGWLTLFGVLLRPILIIIGLIIATIIFGAASYYLTFIYKQAIFSYRNESSGTIDLSTIGQFGIIFYVLLFVYMLYILANSSFKLIDMIPDKAMRWLGGQQPFTGDRPVDVGSFQTLAAAAGYGTLVQGKDAVGGALQSVQKTWGQKKRDGDTGGRKQPSASE